MRRNYSRGRYHEAANPLEWRKEVERETKTMRLCTSCKEFKQFELKSKNSGWIYLHCSDCGGNR